MLVRERLSDAGRSIAALLEEARAGAVGRSGALTDKVVVEGKSLSVSRLSAGGRKGLLHVSRQSGTRNQAARIRCVSNTDIEVGPRDGGGATAADHGRYR